MKKEIQILFDYPSEVEDDIVNGMAYDPERDGESKPDFILNRAQQRLQQWIEGSIRFGEKKRGVIHPEPQITIKPDIGFGDTLARWIDWLIIKPLTRFLDSVKNGTCGCNKRRQWLNKVFSYK